MNLATTRSWMLRCALILSFAAPVVGAGCAGDGGLEETESEEGPTGEAAGAWEAQSETDEDESTHLWIVNRAFDILGKHADRSVDPRALPVEFYLGTLRAGSCWANVEAGLYAADWYAPYNDGGYECVCSSGPCGWKSHFYDPDTGTNYVGETAPTARTRADKFLDFFIDEVAHDGFTDHACFNLGLSLHYMTDVTEPLHAANFTAVDLPLDLHGHLEAWAQTLQSDYALDDWSGYPTQTTPDAVFLGAAVQAKSRAPHLIALGAGCQTDDGEASPVDDECWKTSNDMRQSVGVALRDAQEWTARYLYRAMEKLMRTTEPRRIASDRVLPSELAIDETYAYWTAGPTIQKEPLGGGPMVDHLVTSAFGVDDVAVQAQYVYWVDRAAGKVLRIFREGGAPTTLAASQGGPYRIAVSGNSVFWINRDSGSVMKTSITGGPVTTLATGQTGLTDIAVDGATGDVFWSKFTGAGPAYVMVRRANGALDNPAQEGAAIDSLAIDGQNLYWVVSAKGYVRRAPLGGGVPATIATNQAKPTRVFADGLNVYWSNRGTGDVVLSLPGGGPMFLMAVTQSAPLGIAVNHRGIFWANSGTGAADGSVVRMGPLGAL